MGLSFSNDLQIVNFIIEPGVKLLTRQYKADGHVLASSGLAGHTGVSFVQMIVLY